ncbi:MAG: hypothetical protein IPO58_21925 [Betaproteobacteria bacterium]|nr:hypothetical protein [Betaproteobacteria bacterium]
MTEKTRIIKTLGEPGLLLPVLLNDGLAANDRAKYYFTLLQAAATHARHPEAQVSSLRRERLASGVDDETCDQVVAASTLAATDRPAILVRDMTSTDDIAGTAAAAGVLTAAGGRTSRAAVVAR